MGQTAQGPEGFVLLLSFFLNVNNNNHSYNNPVGREPGMVDLHTQLQQLLIVCSSCSFTSVSIFLKQTLNILDSAINTSALKKQNYNDIILLTRLTKT